MSKCSKCGCNPCGGGCCEPARYSCDFSIQVDPYNPYVWLFDNCGKISRVNIPKIPETDTFLKVDFSSASLVYDAEYHQDVIPGCDLGSIINLDCLRDVEAPPPDSCDILVFDPGCSDCGGNCKPKPAMWRNYHIPDAEDCVVELGSDGYYRVLVKDDCGCIKECRLPAKPANEDKVIYLRDSIPDDPDYPWYYGCYNEDRIGLYLSQNVPDWFGKYDLEVTINYGIQVILSDKCKNMNFRSLVYPIIQDREPDPSYDSSVMQGPSAFDKPWKIDSDHEQRGLAWGTMSMRSSITFLVPKGKEAWLHHEFRLRSFESFPNYEFNSLDGQRIPDSLVETPNQILWTGSRLNALQAIIKPTNGGAFDKNPTRDSVRNQLDDPVDSWQ